MFLWRAEMLNDFFQYLMQFTDCLNYFLTRQYISENGLADLSVNAPLLTAVVQSFMHCHFL